MKKHESIDEYINSFSPTIKNKLRQLRTIVKKEAPLAEEKISYGMIGYKLYGHPLVYIAGFKNHIGFFPLPSGVARFRKELKNYHTSKGTVQFPLDIPLPKELVVEIIKFRLEENKDKYEK